MNVKVAPSLANISRNYWQMNESFLHLGRRIARDFGAHFKIQGNTATLTGSDGLNSDGDPMGSVVAEWSVNLIAWRIKPFVARPQAMASDRDHFDVAAGKWKNVMGMIGGSLPFGGAENVAGAPAPAPNAQVGGQENEGAGRTSEDNRSLGYVVMNGEPAARAGRSCK